MKSAKLSTAQSDTKQFENEVPSVMKCKLGQTELVILKLST